MSTVDIFNLDENINEFIQDDNKEDLLVIVGEFKQGHFLHVLSKIKAYQDKYEVNNGLARIFSLLKATCYSQTGEGKKASDIVSNMYENTNKAAIDDLILYGNLAYMCDYKLSRRIMSDVVSRLSDDKGIDYNQSARAYLILGQAEENLDKIRRAVKYYNRSLDYLQKEQPQDNELILFINYKLGGLYSKINEIDKAIQYLEQTIQLADESNQEVKINCFVSIGKLYGSSNHYEKANSYLKKAIPMLESSNLAGKFVHAEAYSELAYNNFDQKQYDEAIPLYEKAIGIYEKLPNNSKKTIGMMYMQYSYCMEHKKNPEKLLAATNYEKAISFLEKSNDKELIQSALGDVISFFERTGNKKKKRQYENRFVQLINERAN
ncbi:tetratricopeptide repeat protein [Ornithinibacillus halotolerans]|uniref:Tetratricopeptide repeat protein n=1 Tax=Ornithinibacillus halotolerans TaxID=1274357 RepID=A0A916RUB9_9BACI|nr:tetratricopeptide repeat protein [Ornithinibacillus halotolerans]GGA71455.1 hypothetical protein GCM10008025_14190 [Ornithinibacillus halotolerans]